MDDFILIKVPRREGQNDMLKLRQAIMSIYLAHQMDLSVFSVFEGRGIPGLGLQAHEALRVLHSRLQLEDDADAWKLHLSEEEPERRDIQLWLEGHPSTGEKAFFEGSYWAVDLKDAVQQWMQGNPEFRKYVNDDLGGVGSSRFFDNEADARKRFG